MRQALRGGGARDEGGDAGVATKGATRAWRGVRACVAVGRSSGGLRKHSATSAAKGAEKLPPPGRSGSGGASPSTICSGRGSE